METSQAYLIASTGFDLRTMKKRKRVRERDWLLYCFETVHHVSLKLEALSDFLLTCLSLIYYKLFKLEYLALLDSYHFSYTAKQPAVYNPSSNLVSRI